MTRAEHLEWCKQRALDLVKHGSLTDAFASFMSDMSKHPETQNHMALELGSMLLITRQLDTPHRMEEWIKGCN